MECEVEVLTPTQRKVRVEVPAARVAKAFSRIYREFGRQAKVRGFRAGKVPQQVLRGLYRAEIQSRVLSEIVEASLGEAVREHDLELVSEPRLETGELDEAQPFAFSAVVEVKPGFELKNYRGIAVNRERVEVDEQDVDRGLAALQDRRAEIEPVEDRDQVEAGDYVFIDFTGTVEGEPFPGGSAENYPVDIGAGKALPEFERGIVGMQRDVPGAIAVDFPDDAREPSLAGKRAEFVVTVRDIRRKELPPLDDDFARDHGDCDSLGELREKMRSEMQREVEAFQNPGLQDRIMEQLLEAHELEAPPSMVERELSYFMRRAAADRQSAAEASGAAGGPAPTTDELREELTPQARRRVQASLLIEAIAAAEGITASAEEVERRIDALARASGDQAASVREQYGQDWARATLRSQIVSEKTLDFLLEQADVTLVDAEEKG